MLSLYFQGEESDAGRAAAHAQRAGSFALSLAHTEALLVPELPASWGSSRLPRVHGSSEFHCYMTLSQ